LYYFKSNQDKEPIGIIPLENLGVRRVDSTKKCAFEIYPPEQDVEMKACKFDSDGTVVKGHHDSYVVACQVCYKIANDVHSFLI
jgi:cytohesin